MEKQTNTKEIFDAGITMSKKAAERLSAVMDAEGKKDYGLRMEVTTGGCSVSTRLLASSWIEISTSWKLTFTADTRS